MKIIADAGPLLHLFWVGASAWALPPQEIDVVREVWEEVEAHAPAALQLPGVRRVDELLAVSQSLSDWDLDRGELTALTFALSWQDRGEVLVLCDEHKARQACAELSLPVIGSIGLIVEAFRVGRAPYEQAVAALNDLPRRGRLHVRRQLIELAVEHLAASN